MINTIYEDFAQSAKLAPKNSKMIIRHSIRADIPPNDTGLNILLTREGEIMAEHFGKHCKLNIDNIHSSSVKRCLQTAELFAKGYKTSTNKELKITSTNILADSYINNTEKAQKLFMDHSPYWIISQFLRNKKLSGMRNLNESMQTLFSYIFAKEYDNMELFVTHDTFLSAIVCFCHQIQPNYDNFVWPYMLEGAFLYMKDNKIHCIFRGITKSIEFNFNVRI